MRKNIVLIVAIIFVSACGSTPTKTPPNFLVYVDGLSYTEQKSKIYHSELGEKTMNEEPILSLHKECIKSSYSGMSVILGGIEVTDPIKLAAMNGDYTTYSFMKGMGFKMRKSKDPKKALRNSVMVSDEFQEVLPLLTKTSKNVSSCLKSNGWDFKVFKK